MRRIELTNLLPSSAVPNQSRQAVLQDLATTSSTGGSNGDLATLSGVLQTPVKDVTEQITELARHTGSLNSTQVQHLGATQDNTQAVTTNTTAKSGGSSTIGNIANTASGLLGGSLSPILSGLMSLFGGGSKPAAATATAFKLPTSVQSQTGLSGGVTGQIAPVDYGQNSQPRAPQASAAPQVNIQVNAMDSQSFLDHSDEIAKAVRQAMLSSHSLNDVISDL